MKQDPHAARGYNVCVDVQGVCDDVLVAFLGGSQLGFVFPLSHLRRVRKGPVSLAPHLVVSRDLSLRHAVIHFTLLTTLSKAKSSVACSSRGHFALSKQGPSLRRAKFRL